MTHQDPPESASQPHLLEGWALQQSGMHARAEGAYRLALGEGEPEAEYYLGELLTELGRPDEAIPILERGLKDGDVDCWLVLGNAKADMGYVDEALAAYRAADDADDPAGLHNQGALFYSLGRLEEAVEAWRKSYEAGHTAASVFAAALADTGHLDEALEMLAPSAERGDAQALVDIGAIEQYRGHLAEAEVALRRAFAAQDQEASEAYVYLASVLKRTNRHGEARELLTAGAQLGIASAEIQLANDLADEDLHDPDIERLYLSALEHGDLDAQTNLGVHYLMIGRKADAVPLLEQASNRGDDLAIQALQKTSADT